MYARNPDGSTIYRLTDVTMPVQLVEQNDLLFDIPVKHSEPESDFIWRLDAYTDDEEAGIRLLMTINRPINVRRWMPLREDQCLSCGRDGVKYAAKHLCATCYQRQHRAARREQTRAPEQLRLLG